MKVETDIIRQVYDEDGRFFTVRPWPDAPSAVALMTEGEDNKAHFGAYETAMNPEFARQLGKALIACADEIDGHV